MSIYAAKRRVLANITMLPSDAEMERSMRHCHDQYYKMPRVVECFVERANKEAPTGFRVLPWTLNRCVTITCLGTPIAFFSYEQIEDDIVLLLDSLQIFHPKEKPCNPNTEA